MRLFSLILCTIFACLLPCCALGEAIDAAALIPIEMTVQAEPQILDLYCGPTQGFYRHDGQTLDTSKPYVLFGQYDCWAMVAQGTPEGFGPIGWVEAGSITDIPYEPQLAFEDGFAATVEERAQMTDNPLAGNPFDGWDMTLSAGTQVTVLAQLDDWLYVQAEIASSPARVFIPVNAVF